MIKKLNFIYCEGKECPIKESCIKHSNNITEGTQVFTETPGRYIEINNKTEYMCDKYVKK